MKKPMFRMLICVAIFFALVFGWYAVKQVMMKRFLANYKQPAVTINATTSKSSTWQPQLTAIGSLHAIKGVDVSPDVAGIIDEVIFKSGQEVQQGTVLLTIKSTVEQANLKNAKAKYDLAKMNFERENTLFSKKVSSKALLDRANAELKEAAALVESIEAQIEQKTIRAPFDGKLGIRQVNVGQFVSPGTPIVSIQSLNPLYVLFSIPEQDLPNLYLNQSVDVILNLGKGKTVPGKITAINSKVDPATRTILVRATTDNEQKDLYPGMYALINIWLKQPEKVVSVPQTAITYSLSGDSVFIIKKQDNETRAYRQMIKTGMRHDNEVAIIEGLEPGQLIVTSGQQKLQNGSVVIIDEKMTSSA